MPYKVPVTGSWFATFVLGDKTYTHPFQALETKPQKPGNVDRIPETKINRKMEKEDNATRVKSFLYTTTRH